jgi:Uncharacterized protein conserved in bacteria (DUF2325)
MPGKSASPTARAPDIADYLARRPARAASQRLALWEIEGGMQCSIVGTCLSDHDLIAAIQKHKLRVDRGAQSYDIHSYCVRAAGQSSPFSRTLTKLLDRRFAGAVRLMGRASTDEEMRALWERLRDSGQIAAGYWAVMSHAHIPDALKVGVFGEVHMLSHLNGRDANQLALRLAEAERKTADLETRLRRSEQAKLDALAERDAARAALAAAPAPASPPARDLGPPPKAADAPLRHKLAKCERALLSARVRARQAEETIARLTGNAPSPLRPRLAAPRAETAAGLRRHGPLPQRVLYLGGRSGLVPHLREVASDRVAAFLHHDGGIEDSLHRIEEMIEHCDAVVCPVDCVSHGACRMAKAACQRLNKRFLPIASASRSGFERALEELARLGADQRAAGESRSMAP